MEVLDSPILADFKTVRQKGGISTIIVDDLGYTYSSSNSSKTKGHMKSWRCSKKNKKCKASLATDGDWIVVKRHRHNHDPSEPIRLAASDQ